MVDEGINTFRDIWGKMFKKNCTEKNSVPCYSFNKIIDIATRITVDIGQKMVGLNQGWPNWAHWMIWSGALYTCNRDKVR